jgi:hypothetical protein
LGRRPVTLQVLIDDGTSRLMQLRFVPSESTASYFEALQGYLEAHSCPIAFCSDKHLLGMESVEKSAIQPSSTPLPSTLEIARSDDFTHSHRTTTTTLY